MAGVPPPATSPAWPALAIARSPASRRCCRGALYNLGPVRRAGAAAARTTAPRCSAPTATAPTTTTSAAGTSAASAAVDPSADATRRCARSERRDDGARLRRAITSTGCRSSSPPASAGSLDVYGLRLAGRPRRRRGEGALGGVGRDRDAGGCSPSPPSPAGWCWRRAAHRGHAGGWPCRCVAVLVTAVLFYGAHRIRAPAEPAVVLLAAVAPAVGPSRRPGDADDVAHSSRDRPLDAKLDVPARRAAPPRPGRRGVQRRSRLGVPRRRRPPHARRRRGATPSRPCRRRSPASEHDDCRRARRRVGPALDAGRRPTRWRGPPTASTTRPLLPLQGRADGRARADRRRRGGHRRARRQRRRPRRPPARPARRDRGRRRVPARRRRVHQGRRARGVAAARAAHVGQAGGGLPGQPRPVRDGGHACRAVDVERAEAALRSLGFGQVRVRHYGDTARIEVDADELDAAGRRARRRSSPPCAPPGTATSRSTSRASAPATCRMR